MSALIIYGLGNNEPKYLLTKHNAGRILVEAWAKELGLVFQKKDKYFFIKMKVGDLDIFFVYSSGYMNLSGEALYSFCNFFKIKLDDSGSSLCVFQDDSDQLEGNLKLVKGGGSAGHNGINDIYKYSESLGILKNEIWRLKIGIRPYGNISKSISFVLSSLNSEEILHLRNLSQKCFNNQKLFFDRNFEKLQQIFNT